MNDDWQIICRSPKIISPNGVSELHCKRCWCADHAPPPPKANGQNVAAGPCSFQGEQTGWRDCESCNGKTRFKLFACHHPRRPRGPDVDAADCATCHVRAAERPDAKKIILENKLSPGDVLVMTAAITSLHAAYPGEYRTAVRTSCDDLFLGNPLVRKISDGDGETVKMEYPLVHDSDRMAVHFMAGYCDWLARAVGRPVPLAVNRPQLSLTAAERAGPNPVREAGVRGPYWVLNAGTKPDFTAKGWGSWNYQKLVKLLEGKIAFVQVGEAHHRHPGLAGVLSLVGETTTRQLAKVVADSSGAVGPVTLLSHLSSALGRPYVCIAGGREPVQWIQYPKQTTLHTVGRLDCCRDKACWKSRVTPLGDGDEKDNSLCLNVVADVGPVPACLDMVRPETVAAAVLSHRCQ